MIFSRTCEQVLNREKTQTRRAAYPKDELRHSDEGIPYIYNTHMKRVRFCADRDYAVQPGRSQHSIGRIKITNIRMEKLWEISLIDAIDEACLPENTTRTYLPTEYLRGFIQTWIRLYGKAQEEYRWENNPDVIVLEFELIERYD